MEVPLEPYELPRAVAAACHRLLEDLGLVFGCFDLVVTPAGEYIFLEINEMGAFLWIEQRLPELGLLDAFCELLAQGKVDFEWRRHEGSISWEAVIDRAEERLRTAASSPPAPPPEPAAPPRP